MSSTKPPYLLGIDLGTSSVKTAILDMDGRLISLATKEYAFDIPRPGWAEMDPETWFQAAIYTIRTAVEEAGVSSKEIAAIGLTGLMHGPVFLDSGGDSVRPAIIWADQRSAEQVKTVYETIGREKLGQWTGNPLATGFMLATWLWIREHEPETLEKTAHLLLPKDYVRYRLTGQIGAEPSDASATGLYDPFHTRWSTEILKTFSLATQHPGALSPLPPISPSHQIAGTLLPEIAAITGLRPGTPVIFGCSDQTAQAIGNGIVEPGTISCTIGTGGQIFAVTRKPVYDAELRMHLFCHAIPNTWHWLAATLTAGKSLRWLRDNVFRGSSYQQLGDQALSAPAGSDGLVFLPYLAGERTPHMDPEASGAFIGLTLGHGRAHMVRAVLEGVVLSLRQGLEILLEMGIPVEVIVASGGATNHPLWLQLQAEVFNQPIYRTQTREAAATGAAILAGVGVGVYNSVPQACRRTIRWHDEIIYPDTENAAIYNRQYEKFVQLYPAIANLEPANFQPDTGKLKTGEADT